jgi:hypothetical protein
VITWLAMFWLKSIAALWLLCGTAFYLDRHRSTIRRHFSDWRVVLLKFAFAPLTLCYVAGLVAVQPLVVLWQNFAIGCFTGHSGPPIPPGLRERPTCRDANLQTRLDLTFPPNGLVRDEKLAEVVP